MNLPAIGPDAEWASLAPIQRAELAHIARHGQARHLGVAENLQRRGLIAVRAAPTTRGRDLLDWAQAASTGKETS